MAATAKEASALPDGAGVLQLEVLEGEACTAWVQRGSNRHQWAALYQKCSWATAFQSAGYFECWTAHYADEWKPVLVVARRGDALAGLMPLAMRKNLVTGVGAHQAEYHGWLCDDRDGLEFPRLALRGLRRVFLRARVLLRYLPPRIPTQVVEALAKQNPLIALRSQQCPYMDVDKAAIEAVFRKKGNKSKLRRLQREGELVFSVMTPEDMRANIDRIAAQCDLRQGAMNDSCPFTDDKHKRDFHLDWFAANPDQLQVTGLFLNGALISSTMLVVSGRTAHIAILTYAGEHASNSPNKLHLYMAAEHFLSGDVKEIDLTPGGDAWKDRFGTRRQKVFELVAYPSRVEGLRVELPRKALGLVRLTATRLGLLGKRRVAKDERHDDRATASDPGKGRRRKNSGILLWIEPMALAFRSGEMAELEINAIGSLVRWASTQRRSARQEILRDTLSKIEGGERLFSIPDGQGDPQMIWLSRWDDLVVGADSGQSSSHLMMDGFFGRGVNVASRSTQRLVQMTVARALNDEPGVRIFLAVDGPLKETGSILETLGLRSGPVEAAATSASKVTR